MTTFKDGVILVPRGRGVLPLAMPWDADDQRWISDVLHYSTEEMLLSDRSLRLLGKLTIAATAVTGEMPIVAVARLHEAIRTSADARTTVWGLLCECWHHQR